MTRIDGQRLLDRLRALRAFGATGTGVVRPTFSEPDMAARAWLRDLMADAGLDAAIDGVGNVIGRSPNPGPALVLGSHSDTQPEGGWLDGAMGVMDAIEVARALRDDPATRHLAIDVAAWSDEEGTYSSCLGAKGFVGEVDAAVLAERNVDGESVADAIGRVGLTDVPQARLDPDRHIGYLEAHIEQGPHLEGAALKIGVVTSIVGIGGALVTFTGEQNHAGTTRMAIRRDAGLALARFCVAIDERFPTACGPRTVWTTGRITLDPGAPSIIPGLAEMLFQIRDDDPGVIARLEDLLRSMAAEVDKQGRCTVTVARIRTGTPALMDVSIQQAVEQASAAFAGGRSLRMPSGAGHDAQVLATVMPAGMLFVPSIGGISHHWTENTADADIVTGAEVFVEACRRLLARSSLCRSGECGGIGARKRIHQE
jgi:N-carbamoyl-L-amino-acid hydrolase